MKLSVLLIFLVLLVSCERGEKVPDAFWVADAEEAFAESARTGRPIFLYFSAPSCPRLRQKQGYLPPLRREGNSLHGHPRSQGKGS